MTVTTKLAQKLRRALRRERRARPTIARLVELTAAGVFVAFDPADRRPARSTISLALADIGKEVVLMFPDGDIERPIIVGVMQPPPSTATVRVRLDEDRLVLCADKEIVLECGEARITLTRAGKILIRGTYLLSRSSGVNRIKGAAVEIN